MEVASHLTTSSRLVLRIYYHQGTKLSTSSSIQSTRSSIPRAREQNSIKWLVSFMLSSRRPLPLKQRQVFVAGASPRKIHIHLCGMCTLVPAPRVFLHRLDIKMSQSRWISSLASPIQGLAIKFRKSS